MNGWIRLWIVVAAIWAIFVCSVTIAVYKDIRDEADRPWIQHRLSDESRPYYEQRSDDDGPTYPIHLADVNGKKFKVTVPLQSNIELEDTNKLMLEVAHDAGTNFSDVTLQQANLDIREGNQLALQAQKEYQQLAAAETVRLAGSRRSTVKIAAMAAVIPPIVFLIFGYAVAWVRRGFRPQ